MKNKLLKCDDSIIRILKAANDRFFIVDCIKKSMPRWIEKADISNYTECTETDLLSITNTVLCDIEAYQKRLALLHGYIRPNAQKTTPKRKNPSPIITQEMETESVNNLIYNIALKAKNQQLDIVDLLREKIKVIEVSI